jgi:hypothetical protein
MQQQERKGLSQAEWDASCVRARKRLFEKLWAQANPHDDGPLTADDAQRRLHRLLAHTTALAETGLSLPEARARIAALRARTWLGNVGLPIAIR